MISYKVIVIAAALGIVPVVAWVTLAMNKGHRLLSDFNALLSVFFWGVLTAIPASAFQIISLENKFETQVIVWIKNFFALTFSITNAPLYFFLIPIAIRAGIEEISKGIGVLISARTPGRIMFPTDGLILGMIVGLAFGVTENGVYFSGPMNEIKSATGAGEGSEFMVTFVVTVVLRFILSTSSHVIYSAIIGFHLAKGKLAQNFFSKIWLPLKGFFIALAIHTVFNFLLDGSSKDYLGADFSFVVVIIVIFGFVGIWWLYRKNKEIEAYSVQSAQAAQMGFSNMNAGVNTGYEAQGNNFENWQGR